MAGIALKLMEYSEEGFIRRQVLCEVVMDMVS